MLTIHLDSTSATPLYEQIYQYIKLEIINGSLNFHTKLPSTRGLATHLSVSRNTIDMAYGQLLSEGYIESIEKRGYYVSQISNMTHITTTKDRNNNVIKNIMDDSKKENIYTSYLYNFSPFTIDLESFPYNTWRKLSKNCLNDNNRDLFLLGMNQGDDNLRSSITKYLHQSRGVNCNKEQIIIGAGVDYLLQLLAQLIPTKTQIAMENPTYKRAYKIFTGLNYSVAPISLDSSGISMEELKDSDANIVYVTPSHQYPLGVVMPINRRLELLNWSNEYPNRYIIEDDHDSEFRYIGKPIPSLQGMDSNENVIYIGTFSRAIAPAIRIGYMVLPHPLLELYKEKLTHYSCTVSRVDQSILTGFIEGGYFERHLNKMRKVYKAKHDTLMNALKIFEGSIKIHGENAGLHLIIQFFIPISESQLIDMAKENKIKLYGLSEHYITPPKDAPPTILLGYANLSETEIEKGVELLYHSLKSMVEKKI
ncbi:MocR-like pyridoxine biosynthesis transcription factor PdxR [Anaeromicropila herbilytica]|uniref:GntR family transcriptional regulator n=1 Tax=Anaeromicropila herbilytica TaxID=2785025 RepID=A0A7R7IEU3_9FIRM|nr:PLP-dependent aminotransferase family protein [Anaeromicropila herbilytica]BCN31463.1 GntR family transcriptional regulator [Anaeromicropila herbilytica]